MSEFVFEKIDVFSLNVATPLLVTLLVDSKSSFDSFKNLLLLLLFKDVSNASVTFELFAKFNESLELFSTNCSFKHDTNEDILSGVKAGDGNLLVSIGGFTGLELTIIVIFVSELLIDSELFLL